MMFIYFKVCYNSFCHLHDCNAGQIKSMRGCIVSRAPRFVQVPGQQGRGAAGVIYYVAGVLYLKSVCGDILDK